MREGGRMLFAETLGDADLTALLVDSRGDHLAGSFLDADGREAGPEIGAALSGIGSEVGRAMRHLDLGEWQALVIETAAATIALSAAGDGAVVLLAAAAEEPHGLVRRVLARCVDRANQWLSGRAR
jgi:hypothetical protein